MYCPKCGCSKFHTHVKNNLAVCDNCRTIWKDSELENQKPRPKIWSVS